MRRCREEEEEFVEFVEFVELEDEEGTSTPHKAHSSLASDMYLAVFVCILVRSRRILEVFKF